jgi:hypothetical protein
MQTGSIVDFYDDPSGTVLKTKLAFAQLPAYIRQADYQSEEKLAALPDDAFALVMVDQGTKIRKFACVDKGNTALSAIYFLENKDKLPEEAQKVAAANLVEYCQAFQIEPPWQLQKEAVDKPGLLRRMGKSLNAHAHKNPYGLAVASGALGTAAGLTRGLQKGREAGKTKEGELDQTQKTAFWNSPKDTLSKGDAFAKELERMEAAGKDMNNLSWKELSDIKGKAKANLGAGKKKSADLTGSAIMPLQSNPNKEADEDSQLKATDEKRAAALYVDITGKSPPPQFEKRAHSRYCLEKLGQGRFPIDSYGEVLDANKWFEENGKSLHPQDRREYCTKLAARAGELHISVTDNIRKYAGKNFAPDDDVRASVCTRMQFWADDAPERDTLSGMLDKYASASPDQFCQELTAFDVKTGLDQYWDDFIVDPVACVFGLEKTAEWLWEQGADRLTQDLLDVGVHDSQKIHAIKAKFGPELASELVEKPSEVFDSLPLDSKRIIARILNDTQ